MSSYASIASPIEVPAFGRAWRDGPAVYATVRLGDATLHFDGPAAARALGAECLIAAEEMEALPPAPGGAS